MTDTTTYAELLSRAAAEWGDREVLVFPETRLTYAGLHERAERRARELRALGVEPGDRVGILMQNCQEFIEVLFGAMLADAVAVPINVRFKVRELGHVIDTAQIAVVVSNLGPGHVDFASLLDAARAGGRTFTVADVAGGRPLAPDADGVALAAPGRGAEEIGMLMFTSGTTANPKGCMLTHGALARNAYSFAEVFELVEGDRIWDPLPFFHLASLVPLTGLMTVGGTYVSTAHFNADEGVRQLGDEQVTIVYSLFPAVTQDLIHHPELAARRPDGIRMVCNLGTDEVQRRVVAAFPGAQLVSAYGITECTGTVAYSWPDDTFQQRVETCGRPFRGVEAAIADLETGRRLPQGEKGELLLRGPIVFKGYFADPENTRKVLSDDGWLRTGDVCSLDPDGRIIYHGRDKDMLKVGGENVGALEVESVLASHAGVKLAQVVGVPDDRLVEVPAAFVELAPGADVGAEELIELCRGQLASFKVPRHVRFVTEWPMSATKIQKFRLREQLVRELDAVA